jgi:hypothetical protein
MEAHALRAGSPKAAFYYVPLGRQGRLAYAPAGAFSPPRSPSGFYIRSALGIVT